MIDLSHDNSGKDPDRQPEVAEAVGDADRHRRAGDRRGHAGVVPRRRPPGPRRSDATQTLVYGQSITDGCIGWDTTVEVLDGLAEAVRARRDSEVAPRRMRIAVLGRRPDRRFGGAGRARAPGGVGRRVRRLAGRPGARRWSAARSTRPATPSPPRSTDADAVFVAVPGRPAAADDRRGAGRGAGPAASSPTSAPPSAPSSPPTTTRGSSAAIPLAGAESAGVEHARADLFEGATWYLTPAAHTSGVLYERLHRLLHGLGARPTRSTPRPTTGSWPPSPICPTCWPTCSSPRPRAAWPPATPGCRPPGRASATPPGWRARRARSGPTST